MDTPLIDDNWCVVCGSENPHGLNINFQAENGHARALFRSERRHQGYRDIMHGGILATLLDEAAIKAVASLGVDAVTAEISVKFKTPVYTGETCMVYSSVAPLRRGFFKAESWIKKSDETTAAQAVVILRAVTTGEVR